MYLLYFFCYLFCLHLNIFSISPFFNSVSEYISFFLSIYLSICVYAYIYILVIALGAILYINNSSQITDFCHFTSSCELEVLTPFAFLYFPHLSCNILKYYNILKCCLENLQRGEMPIIFTHILELLPICILFLHSKVPPFFFFPPKESSFREDS